MNSMSELLKYSKEDEERKKLHDAVEKEIALFNLNLKEDEDKDEEPMDVVATSAGVQKLISLPPGILFFDTANFSSTFDSLRPTGLNIKGGLHLLEISDVAQLENFELLLRCEKVTNDTHTKKKLFKYFFMLLFTDQTECVLDSFSSILIEIAQRTKFADYFRSTIIRCLPTGIQNLGGRINVVYPGIKIEDSQAENHTGEVKAHNPLPNLNSVICVMKYVITREVKLWKEKFTISEADIDDLVFLLLVISQDPVVLYSNLLPSIQDLIALLLDIYPSDDMYSEKVQDLVERAGVYWDDSNKVFNHHLAYYVASNILPLSRRGSNLRTSMAYYSLMCCLLPDDTANIHEFILVPNLSRFCHDNIDAMKNATVCTLNSVVRLIDLAIDWPVNDDRDKEDVRDILELIKVVSLSKESDSDLYQKTKLKMLLRVITLEWEALLKKPEKKLKQTKISNHFKRRSFDDYSESPY